MKQNLSTSPTVVLRNGVSIPQIGFGTWPLKGGEAVTVVKSALAEGYRHIDTAENYQNEEAVGEAIRQSGVPREQIFVTTKFNRQWHSVQGARTACEASLKRLGLDYADLLLIHWPNPDQNRFVDAFDGLQRLLDAGLVRAIGTSNFKTEHLQRLVDNGMVPHVNQIQLAPYHQRLALRAVHAQHGIVTESWSPLGKGTAMLQEPAIVVMAAAHGKTPAQIVLRWHVQQGLVAIPKSSDAQRQRENLQVFDFALGDVDMAAINALQNDGSPIMDADSFGH
ncbi:MAG: aldo/keto reductase [Comamonas sp.]